MFFKTGWDSKFELEKLRITESSSGENRIVEKEKQQPTNQQENQPTNQLTNYDQPTNKTSKTNQHNLTNQRKPTKPTELPTSENPHNSPPKRHHAVVAANPNIGLEPGSVDSNREVEKNSVCLGHLYKQS